MGNWQLENSVQHLAERLASFVSDVHTGNVELHRRQDINGQVTYRFRKVER